MRFWRPSATLRVASRGRDKPPLKNQTFLVTGNRDLTIRGECVGVHSGKWQWPSELGPIPRFTSWRNKLRPIVARAGLTVRRLFLNFDVAIFVNRAQHLLALARKVEQGGSMAKKFWCRRDHFGRGCRGAGRCLLYLEHVAATGTAVRESIGLKWLRHCRIYRKNQDNREWLQYPLPKELVIDGASGIPRG